MKLTRTYEEFNSTITIYQDHQKNEYHYENGELFYSKIFDEERTYFLDGSSEIM